MPLPNPPDSAVHQPSLFNSVRTFWRVMLGSFHTRLDLFTTELEEEAVRLAYLAAAGVLGLMALHGAFFFGMVWILAAVWDTEYRLWVIGGIFLAYVILAGGSLFYAWTLIKGRPRFLDQTLTELKRDVEGFKTSVHTPKTETP